MLTRSVLVIGSEKSCADFIHHFQGLVPKDIRLVDGAYEHGATNPALFQIAYDEKPEDFGGYCGVLAVADQNAFCSAYRIYDRYIGLPVLDTYLDGVPPGTWLTKPNHQEFLDVLSHTVVRLAKPINLEEVRFHKRKDQSRTFTTAEQHRLCHAIAMEDENVAKKILESVFDGVTHTQPGRPMNNSASAAIQYLSNVLGLSATQIETFTGNSKQAVRQHLVALGLPTHRKEVVRRSFDCVVTTTPDLQTALADLLMRGGSDDVIYTFLETHLGGLRTNKGEKFSLAREAAISAMRSVPIMTRKRAASILRVTPAALYQFTKKSEEIQPSQLEIVLTEKFARVAAAAGNTENGEAIATVDDIKTIMARKHFGAAVSADRMAARLRGIWVRFEDGKLPLQEEMDLRGSFMHFASQHLGTLCGKSDAQARIWFEKRAAKAKGTAGASTAGLIAYNARGGCKFP